MPPITAETSDYTQNNICGLTGSLGSDIRTLMTEMESVSVMLVCLNYLMCQSACEDFTESGNSEHFKTCIMYVLNGTEALDYLSCARYR